ncbi:MAG: hypothetical protein JSW71_11790 [Gemmatimonadota bacterium]|nr:MAG: hypothetical protein JSW71_11790 [Gemmatimonadota bacterium]
MAQDDLGGFENKLDGLFAEEGGRGEAGARPMAAPGRANPVNHKPPRRPTASSKGSALRKLITPLVLVIVFIGLAHAVYSYIVRGDAVESWEVTEGGEVDQPPATEPQPRPVTQDTQVEQDTALPPADPEGEFAIQVALCNSPECVAEFQSRLLELGFTSEVGEGSANLESVEVYSITTFASRIAAQELADRINREHSLAGQAYVLDDEGGLRISMGNFTDLGRAVVVKDTLNRSFLGEVAFTTRVWSYPISLQSVVAGDFGTREEAEAALSRLVQADSVFAEAYVVRR